LTSPSRETKTFAAVSEEKSIRFLGNFEVYEK
jgi:hypothetical protein